MVLAHPFSLRSLLLASKSSPSTGSVHGDPYFFLSFAGFLVYPGLFSLHSPRYPTALQKGRAEFAEVFWLAAKRFWFCVLYTKAPSARSPPALPLHTHSFPGGPLGAFELAALLLCICTLSADEFQVLMRDDSSVSRNSSQKYFAYSATCLDIPWRSITHPKLNSSAWLPTQLCSQLWTMT